MRTFPPLPDLLASDSPDDVLRGHLWLLELVEGTGLRFRMDDSGLLQFGGPDETYRNLDDAPLAVRPAIRRVRARFDREALRASVEDPEAVVFFGVATHHRGIDYDWERLPPFLGAEVWVAEATAADESAASTASSTSSDTSAGAFRPPDAVEAIFDGVGLDPITAVEREVNARDFAPAAYSIPESAWDDGPAAGVVVRNKRGGRGVITGERSGSAPTWDGEPTPATRAGDAGDGAGAIDRSAARYATPGRFERAVGSLERDGTPVTVGALAERVVEVVARETPARFDNRHAPPSLDPDQFRAAAVDLAREFLESGSEHPS